MFTYPHINPVALRIGALKIHWYGITYILGITAAWLLAHYRVTAAAATKKAACANAASPSVAASAVASPTSPVIIATTCAPSPLSRFFTATEVSDLIFYCAIGVILGGRVGYILFYYFSVFIANPLVLFKVWDGGMSFHGGVIGVVVALYCFAKKTKRWFIEIADFTVPLIPIGLFFGRIGNFINGELWGRVTNVAWGMVFPDPAAGALPRYPSQLYEAFFEGIVLFVALWIYSSVPRARGKVTAWFLIGYGCMRCGCEFFREPDVFIGFVAFDWLTMGQLLSLPMIVAGVLLLLWSRKVNK